MKAKLVKLIDKNFKLILRSKISSLIIIFGPLLVMFLAGFAFDNSNDFELQIGIYQPESTNLSQRFIEAFDSQFILTQYVNETDCIQDVRNLKLNGCIGFSENFQLQDESTNQLLLYVDNSKVNIVDLIQNAINRVIYAEANLISTDLTTVLVTSITDVSNRLDKWKSQINTEVLGLQNELLTSIDSSRSQLQDLDVETNGEKTVTSSLVSSRDNFESLISSAKNNADSAIKISEDLIKDVKDTNETTATIDSILNSAQTKIQSLKSSSSHNQSANINDFLQTVNNAIAIIEDTSSKLAQTKQVQSDVTKRFSENKKILDDIKEKLTVMAVEMEVTKTRLASIQITDATSIANPVESQIIPVTISTSKLDYIFPSLMILVIMFVSMMLGATMVVIEKLSPSKFRLFTTPTADYIFITSIFISTLVVAVYQITVLLIVAEFIFGIDVFSNIHNSIALLLFAAIIFTLIGMALGYIFSNEQTTILGAISLGSAFILVSDLILPLESISEGLQQYIIYTPFVLLSNLLRRTILFDASILDFGWQIIAVVGFSIILFVLIILTHKLLKVIYLFNHLRAKNPK